MWLCQYEMEQITDVSDKYTTKIDNEKSNKVTGTITSNSMVAFDNETIREVVAPEKEENPYTVDKHYLIILIATVALMLIILARALSIKRFG